MQDKIFISLTHNYYENIKYGLWFLAMVKNLMFPTDNGSKATLSISGQAQNIISPVAFRRGFSRDDRAPYSGWSGLCIAARQRVGVLIGEGKS